MTRLLCVGDLHLDKGGRYGRVPGERLAEQEKVWAEALALARHHRVDAVLFAGDAFEKRHPSTDALLAFERPLVHHQVQGGPTVIAIPGNHDRSGVSDWCALDVFAEAGLLELHSRPTVRPFAGDVSIAYLPWAPVSRIVAREGGGDRDDVNTAAAELLLETARGLRAEAAGTCILLTHFSISGASTPDGMDVGLFREPVLSVADLEAIGFDAIVASHIHRPQRLDMGDPACWPLAIYTGSPMPLDFGEGRCDHGVWLLDVDMGAEFLPIESRRFVTLDADITGDVETSGLAYVDIGHAANDEEIDGGFVKVRCRATEDQARRIDIQTIREGLANLGAHNVWIELDVQRETRARVAGMDESVSDGDALEMWLDSQSVNGDQAPALREKHGAYLSEIA